MDKLYYNARVYSMAQDDAVYDAVGMENGKITFLGSNAEAEKIDCCEKIDLLGKTVLPGLIDSHLHMMNYAYVNRSFAMQGCSSIENIVETGKNLCAKMDSENDGGWLYGRGWNELKFTDEQRVLNRFDLDRISTDRPILFIRVCGHKAAVNSKAMEIVMNLPETADFLEQIDAENGILTEASVKLCYNAMTEPTLEQLKEMIAASQVKMNERGITSVYSDNFLSLPGRNIHRIMQAYREMAAAGELTLRVTEQASFTLPEHLKAFLDAGYRTGDGDDYYKIGPMKFYQDGSLGARTALMNEKYEGTDVYGTAVHDEQELQQLVDMSYDANCQILIHCIGDKAADMVADAYIHAIEKYGKKPLRLAINHIQLASEGLYEKMKQYDMVGYIQPVFVASDKNMFAPLMGEHRVKRSYQWKTLLDMGIPCGGGSDAPVESFDVLENIQIAVTRDALNESTEGWNPAEKLSVKEAVKLFTSGNAYVNFDENRTGTLEIGKLADLVVLDRDIFETDPHEISGIGILRTVTGGREVYTRM